ncbi:hypothetical protein ACWEKJ_20895 [Amycolatopsis thermoflava]
MALARRLPGPPAVRLRCWSRRTGIARRTRPGAGNGSPCLAHLRADEGEPLRETRHAVPARRTARRHPRRAIRKPARGSRRGRDPAAAEVARADVVVAAAGRPGLVRGGWIKPGAVVVDAGYADNRGDVKFAAAAGRASHITPVPGGVGVMTIANLPAQTIAAARRHEAQR